MTLSSLILSLPSFAQEGGHICIALRQEGQDAVIDGKDDGIGLNFARNLLLSREFKNYFGYPPSQAKKA